MEQPLLRVEDLRVTFGSAAAGVRAVDGVSFDVYPGATGENITVRNLDVDALQVGDQLRFAGGVVAEITKTRKPCYVLDAIDPALKQGIFGRCGVLAKVICEGELRTGESIEVVPVCTAFARGV